MIPTYEEIMLPLLKDISDGMEHSLSEVHDKLALHFELDEEELRTRLPSGTQPVFRNRVGWARTYMKKALLIESTKRAHFKITQRGIELLKENPSVINAKFLTRYDEFVRFKTIRKENNYVPKVINEENEQTPELINDILDTIKGGTATFFENLIVDLVIAMGYGGSRRDAGQAVGKSRDGGIDGIIKEDKLGLDIIYLQAKKWERTVPIKEVRDFTGALAAKV